MSRPGDFWKVIVNLAKSARCEPADLLRGLGRVVVNRAKLYWTCLANWCGRSAITDPGGPVVSLTSYGRRVQSVHLAIESIGRGQMRPARLILWLDDPSVFYDLPSGIRRLEARGLEVKLCKEYGPHKKYYPYLESSQELRLPLVTADDDVLYPRYWLKRLVEAFQQFPDVVNCHRARVMEVNETGFTTYEKWRPAQSTKPSHLHFAIGVGGTLYPGPIQQRLKREGSAFLECCPKADDIWLHVQALRLGYKVRQISEKAFRLVYIPGTQRSALYHDNLGGGENDRQVKTTYLPADIDLLLGCDDASMIRSAQAGSKEGEWKALTASQRFEGT
jgi:hypothetical protein